MKKTIMAALFAAVGAAAAYAAPSADFDKGLDAKAFLAAAKEEAKTEKVDLGAQGLKYRAERDCATFAFAPGGPEISDAVWLRSTEYYEECTTTGDPRHGGGTFCREVPRWTHQERVQLELRGRQQLLPWERETFEACLEGSWLNVYVLQAAHEYKSAQNGGNFVLTAGARKAMDPDKNGITAGAPAAWAKALKVEFKDQWASYYTGEKVKIKLALKRDVPNWFDPTVLEKEFEFDAAASYAVDFNAYLGEFKEALKPGKEYYVEWGFSRIGKISKPTYMKVGDGPKSVYHPAAGLVASLYGEDQPLFTPSGLPLPGGGVLPPGAIHQPAPPPPHRRAPMESCSKLYAESNGTCHYTCDVTGVETTASGTVNVDGSVSCPRVMRPIPGGS